VVAVVQELQTPREISRNIGGFTLENLLDTIVGFTNSRANDVSLILTRELTASNEQVRTGFLGISVSGTHAETREPDVEILLELRRLSLLQTVMRYERDVNQAEGVLEDDPDFSFERIFFAEGGT
jgi:hypothetical protein